MENFRKVVHIGTFKFNNRLYSGYSRISLTDGCLSIVGVIGPTRNGNAQVCGQCYDQFKNVEVFDVGWNQSMLDEYISKWKRWHLNNMIPGSPRQMEWIREQGVDLTYSEILEKMPESILHDSEYYHNGKPYSYGSAWLREPVPDDVIDWFKALPDTVKECPWYNL